MIHTAVETIISEFNKELEVAIQIGNESKIRIIKHLINIATSYLPMEKEQIIDAHIHAQFNVVLAKKEIAEQYYNETFKSK
jgi:hypothetical protein